MRAITSVTYLIIVSCCSVVFSYNTNRQTCHYYENPQLIPIFRTRVSPYFPVDKPKKEELYVGGYFPGQDVEPESGELMKKFNVGYLNVDEPLRTISDLIELNSEEIGTPDPRKQPDPTKLWKLDEVSSLVGPELLPDVVLTPETPVEEQLKNVNPGRPVLDEQEIKLGRKIVDDAPSIPDLMPVEHSLRQEAEDMGNEFGEKYLKEAHFMTPPSVVLDTVVQIKEPTFMEELNKMKLEKLASSHPDLEQEEVLNTPTEAPAILDVDDSDESPSVQSADTPQVVPQEVLDLTVTSEMPPLTTATTLSSVTENTIEKETNAGDEDEDGEVTVRPKVTQKSSRKGSKRRSKGKSVTNKTETEAPNTPSRFSENDETLIDGLLSVL